MDSDQRILIAGLILFALSIFAIEKYCKNFDAEDSRKVRIEQTAKHFEEIAKEARKKKTHLNNLQ